MPPATADPLPPSSFAIDVPDTLLARARAGERAAFEQLYRWFERPVFTLALRIWRRHREEAAEVLQDTMLKVLEPGRRVSRRRQRRQPVLGAGCGRSRSTRR